LYFIYSVLDADTTLPTAHSSNCVARCHCVTGVTTKLVRRYVGGTARPTGVHSGLRQGQGLDPDLLRGPPTVPRWPAAPLPPGLPRPSTDGHAPPRPLPPPRGTQRGICSLLHCPYPWTRGLRLSLAPRLSPQRCRLKYKVRQCFYLSVIVKEIYKVGRRIRCKICVLDVGVAWKVKMIWTCGV